jgi:hypothetical protein
VHPVQCEGEEGGGLQRLLDLLLRLVQAQFPYQWDSPENFQEYNVLFKLFKLFCCYETKSLNLRLGPATGQVVREKIGKSSQFPLVV